jgi:hypothetical protein
VIFVIGKMELEEDEIDAAVLVSVTSASVGGLVLSMRAQQEIYLEKINRHSQYRYRVPLPVPIGMEFHLDHLTEEWCLEFFRYV